MKVGDEFHRSGSVVRLDHLLEVIVRHGLFREIVIAVAALVEGYARIISKFLQRDLFSPRKLMVLPDIDIRLYFHKRLELQAVFSYELFYDIFTGAGKRDDPDLTLERPDIVQDLFGLGLMNGKNIPVRVFSPDHFSKRFDREVVVLRRDRESLFAAFPGQISALHDLVLGDHFFGICDEFPSLVGDGDPLVGPLKDQNSQLILQFPQTGRECRLGYIKFCGRLSNRR